MQTEKDIYFLFKGSLLVKGVISLLEIISGLIIFFLPTEFIHSFALFLTRDELLEEPTSFFAQHVLSGARALTSIGTLFIGLYLLSRGGIKLGLIIALLKNKLWAYPWSLGVLGLFVLYQIVEILKTHSLALIALSLFDLVVMYFIWREFRIVKKRLHKR